MILFREKDFWKKNNREKIKLYKIYLHHIYISITMVSASLGKTIKILTLMKKMKDGRCKIFSEMVGHF